ncbi:MAG TPA: hypothetical protein VD927_13700 [Chryseosolibacter sp.]|nr:hypothetical protein [Chryseosolibacter sp.]
MDEDLFGNKFDKEVDAAHKELVDYDKETFDERLKRLKYVNRVFPFGQREYGSSESVRIFDEAVHSYIFGFFISTIILAQAFIERRFQEYFRLRFDDKRSKYTLDQLLKEFRKTGMIDDYFIDKIDKIRLKRNPLVHLKTIA